VEGSSKSAVAEGAVLGIGRAEAMGEKKRDDRKNIDGLSVEFSSTLGVKDSRAQFTWDG
jgi:hypothetical protein